MANKRAGIGGRPPRIKAVRVNSISPSRYPQFLKDEDHQYSGESETARIKALVDICGRVFAQNLAEGRYPRRMPSRKEIAA